MNLELISKETVVSVEVLLSVAELVVIKGELTKLMTLKQRMSNEPKRTVWLSDEESEAVSRITILVSKMIPNEISSLDELARKLFMDEETMEEAHV